MISLFYSLVVLAMLAYFAVIPRKRFQRPSSGDNDDDGGEPLQDDLPDLDLPPGISLPINDFEPDYNRPRKPKPQLTWTYKKRKAWQTAGLFSLKTLWFEPLKPLAQNLLFKNADKN